MKGKDARYYRKYRQTYFLETLNNCHSSVMFTMAIESNHMLPFLLLPFAQPIYLCRDKGILQPRQRNDFKFDEDVQI